MSETVAAIRRESVKYQCIADQTEGVARRLNLAKAITYEALAGIFEDPEKRAELFRMATGKPKLRLVSDESGRHEAKPPIVLDRVSALLTSLWLDYHD